MEIPFLRSEHNYDRDLASLESALECKDPSLTQQSFAAECDINTIVKRFGLTGQLPDDLRAPTFGDFTSVGDFHSAMNAVRGAAETFMQMPADVRARFDNDAGKFVDFCSDEKNLAEMKKLGLTRPDLESKVADIVSPEPAPAPKVDDVQK